METNVTNALASAGQSNSIAITLLLISSCSTLIIALVGYLKSKQTYFEALATKEIASRTAVIAQKTETNSNSERTAMLLKVDGLMREIEPLKTEIALLKKELLDNFKKGKDDQTITQPKG